MKVVAAEGAPLSVPLLEPFVIASGALDATRSIVIRLTVENEPGGRAVGLGEAAALPPVTACDQPDLLRELDAARKGLSTITFTDVSSLSRAVADRIPNPVLRAGVEAALLDAMGQLEGRSVAELLADGAPTARAFVTDITIPIAAPAHMADLAAAHRARGFSVFKVKVGRDLDADCAALRAIQARVPDARFRIDANGGYDLDAARALLDATQGLTIECFEQPCARGAEESMAELARSTPVPLVADESLRSPQDLELLLRTRCVAGVNLKLVKLGGLVAAAEVGRRARAAGLSIMVGAMVETRLGLSAMMHVASALGGADWVDLDTQMLLAREAFSGGYAQSGPELSLDGAPGLGIREVSS